MTSIKQQFYNALVATVTGVTWYGSDDNTDKMLPPPIDNAPTPWGYLRFNDTFDAIPGDTRAMVQIRIGDSERRQYSRINAKLLLCEVLFARNPAKEYIDTDTGEVWYFPEPAGWSPESEDLDRPGTLIRVAEFMFRRRIKAAAIAATIDS
jgi:hypothetical protein